MLAAYFDHFQSADAIFIETITSAHREKYSSKCNSFWMSHLIYSNELCFYTHRINQFVMIKYEFSLSLLKLNSAALTQGFLFILKYFVWYLFVRQRRHYILLFFIYFFPPAQFRTNKKQTP